MRYLLNMITSVQVTIAPLQAKVRESCQDRQKIFWLTSAEVVDIRLHYVGGFLLLHTFFELFSSTLNLKEESSTPRISSLSNTALA